jgi:alcohol dehydrogenase class IV
VIVRWGVQELPGLLEPYGRSLMITSRRWQRLELTTDRYLGVRPHAPVETVREAIAAAAGADVLVGLGGGSAIDTSKAVSAETGLPLIAVPTTYAGAEWTTFFGMRDEARRLKAGGSGANTVAIVYEPDLTLDLPRAESCGTAMNALAHCVEALYVQDAEEARAGAALIDEWLPRVLEQGHDRMARTHLLEGAMYGGMSLRLGFFLGHAMAQALGGRYGLPHGAMNAICLPPAMRFNGANEPISVERVEELARLGGFVRLRDFDVPEDDLGELAEATAVRPAARSNPRPASPAQIEGLLRSVW